MHQADVAQMSGVVARLALGVLLGSLIGIERQWRQKMAGLRTNALVALGAAGFVSFSAIAMGTGGDSTRVAAQVVSGIGFLGAGVILREGVNVHGLNTAATLWCSAMVGTFAGAGLYVPSTAAAAFVIGTNLVLRPLVRRLSREGARRGDTETHYAVMVTCSGAVEAMMRKNLQQVLTTVGLELHRLDSDDIADTPLVRISAQASAPRPVDSVLEDAVGRLGLEPAVTGVSWQIARSIPEA